MSRTAKEDRERSRAAPAGDASGRALELCGGLAFQLDDRACVVAISGATRELLGLEPEEIVGTDVLTYIHPEDRATILSASIAARAEAGRQQEVAARCARADGGWWRMRGATAYEDGRWYATALPVAHDPAGEEREAELAAEQTNAAPRANGRPAALTQATLDALGSQIAVIDARGEIVATNRAWRDSARAGGADLRRVGVGANYVEACEADPADEDGRHVARALRAMLDGSGDGFTHEYRCPGPLGERWFELRASHLPGTGSRHVVVQHFEVTDRRDGAERLRAARDYFRAVADAMGEGLFTLDGEGRLIYMNESAERILGWRAEELAGRTMHDATHFRKADGTPHPIAECPLTGVRETGKPVRVPDDVFVRKDGRDVPVEYTGAAFELADGERGVTVVFEEITERKNRERELARQVEALDWLRGVRDALAEDRFVLHAQPIVDLQTGKRVQQELLIRMRNGRGLIPPDRFLPPAEEYGLVTEIDRWVIAQAGRLLRAGHTAHVNVSARSIATGDMLEAITDALAGGDPAGLVVELTETVLIDSEGAALDFARGVRELGGRIALDDFGTGFGGFSYLKRLPVDLLKIDREFVADLSSARASRHVVEAVVALAQSFGYRTVAEGVEDAETLRLLRELGVDLAQGFHIARPMPLAIPEAAR